MIATLIAASLLAHRTMWVTPNYVLAQTGSLVAVRGDSREEYVDTKTRHLGALITAGPLKSGGFVYVLKDGGVRTWTKEAGITKLSSLPPDTNLLGNWTIFPFANGTFLLQSEDPTATIAATAYLYDTDQTWHAVQPDVELNNAIVMHGEFMRLEDTDQAHAGHVNFTELSLDDEGGLRPISTDPGAPVIGHGGPMRPQHIINFDTGDFQANRAIATDNDTIMAFANDTQVAVFNPANHQRLATYTIGDFKPDSLVVAQSESGEYILYGLTHQNIVRKHMANPG